MNRKAIAFLFVFLYLCNSIYSQGENNIWCISDSNMIDFNFEPPQIGTSKIKQKVGTSTISDKNGNLLFYTNGMEVWDRNHNRMPNGFGLGADTFTSQNLIIKKPGTENLYYLFTSNSIFTYTFPEYKGLCYTIIDMNLNGGNGDVIPSSKNISLLNPSCAKITSTFHANQRDIWVVSREMWSNRYWAYLLTPSGIVDSVHSNVGVNYGISRNDISNGCLKFSSNSKLLGACLYTSRLEVYKFNNSSGILTYYFADSILNYNTYDCEFSHNNTKMYYSNNNKLYQIDLKSHNPNIILSTKLELITKLNSTYEGIFLYMSKNKKIYYTNYLTNSIGVINEPDSLGVKSNTRNDGITLNNICKFGLQNIYYFQLPSIYANNTCLDDTTRFHISDTSWMSKIVWDFGDGTGDTSFYPNHIYSDTGTYHVTATYYYYTCDSVRVQRSTVYLKDKPSISFDFSEASKCADIRNITVRGIFDSLIWNDDTNLIVRNLEPGNYSVSAFNECGISTSNISIAAPSGFDVNLITSDLVIAIGDIITLNANVTSSLPIINYDWNPLNLVTCSNSTCSKVSSSPIETTLYSVTATNSDSCTSTDTITVIVRKDKAVFIPSAFTPNGDGKNETFDVQIAGATNISVSIWDRWGEKVYENPTQQNGAGQGWDGIYKRNQMQTDTYTYQMDVTYFDGTKKVLSGTVLLMK